MSAEFNAILITREHWATSQLSLIRHYGVVKINGKTYVVVGNELDMIREDYLRFYTKLGRAEFIRILREQGSDKKAFQDAIKQKKIQQATLNF